jgi:hypothetical protein
MFRGIFSHLHNTKLLAYAWKFLVDGHNVCDWVQRRVWHSWPCSATTIVAVVLRARKVMGEITTFIST